MVLFTYANEIKQNGPAIILEFYVLNIRNFNANKLKIFRRVFPGSREMNFLFPESWEM